LKLTVITRISDTFMVVSMNLRRVYSLELKDKEGDMVAHLTVLWLCGGIISLSHWMLMMLGRQKHIQQSH
jgi:hypothetical protein